MNIKSLKGKATQARIDALKMVYNAGSGHLGGSFSMIDILTILYQEIMVVNPEEPKWEERDRLVLSKGHCTPGLYSVLAARDFFPKSDLAGFRDINSYLSGHAEINVPGVDASTGSLGHGLSVACGMALAAKTAGKNNYVYSIHGDGELQEGMIWEAVMSASKFKLNNLVAVIDNNNLQIDGTTEEIMSPLYPLAEKFQVFGWHVIKCDGHNFDELKNAFTAAKKVREKPIVIIASTVKGKGVSYMENDGSWHGACPSEEQYNLAFQELKATLKNIGVNH